MKHFTFLVLTLLCSLSLAASTTYDFTTSVPSGWEVSPKQQGFDDRGIQLTAATTLTLKGVSNVTNVTIVASSNTESSSSYSLTVNVGSAQFGSTIDVPKVTNETYAFPGGPADGDLVVTVAKSGKKSLYIKSITIEGDVPEPEDPAERLDPDYVYDEPTIIEPKDELGKMEIDTIVNNILLTCSDGAFYSTDIRVMANATLFITAAKPIRAIRIDGGNRKAFSASASAGELTYAVDYEGDIVNAEPVLLIKDINEPTVSITCYGQLRIQKLYVYFDEDPDVEIEDEEEEPVPVENCNISSTGEWNFVASYTDTEYLWSAGTVAFVMVSNPDWRFYSDGYPHGDGEGMYLMIDFSPTYVYPDWSGTYSMAEYTLTGYTWGYYYSPGESEEIEDDISIIYAFESGSITVELNGETYDLSYSLTDTDGITHQGTVSGLCAEPGAPMGMENIEAVLDTLAPMFNIIGQPVNASYRGIIIQNGRKFLMLP
jgi:predicted heme/steroid binding protein